MIKVNLLPKELRKKKKVPFFDKYLLYVLAAIILVGIVLWVQTTRQQIEISRLDDEIAMVEAEIQKYNQLIKKVEEARALRDKIRRRMTAIQELDIQRPLAVKLLENFSQLIPEFVWVEEFREIERIATITGKSYNLKGVANLIVGLIQSEYFDQIRLNFVRDEAGKSTVPIYHFEMSANIVFLSAGEYAGEFIMPIEKPEETEGPKGKRARLGLVARGRDALELDKDRARESMQGLGR